MSHNNNDFFRKKKIWSIIKDDLLDGYLNAYMAKIMHTGKPLHYLDGFAGKGMFDDGEPGSPVIACKIIEKTLERTRAKESTIRATFIEARHGEALRNNIKDYSFSTTIPGRYEKVLPELISEKPEENLFLYVDPYGIKELDIQVFKMAAEIHPSVELLLNLNTFGFFRDACRVFDTELVGVDGLEDLIEQSDEEPLDKEKVGDYLTRAAGGEYWKDIVADYKAMRIDGYAAEQRLSKEFCTNLSINYQYVLNLPIRIKQGSRPKYRLIHATNHEDGCVLMYENMSKRWESLQQIQRGGQMGLFEEDVENGYVDLDEVKDDLLSYGQRCKNWISINKFWASFVCTTGVICPLSKLRTMLREMEQNEILLIRRDPAYTKTGAKSTFLSPSKGHKAWVKAK